jgi:lipopolysaccharide/colanic/teichoic acid biosynthesis glycosyltransferase
MSYTKSIKPIGDYVLAIMLILLLSPLLIAIVSFLFLIQKRNIIFLQWRVGKNENLFQLYKFKTMNDATDENGELLPDMKRLTFIGKILRQTSLDELPQLFNVLKGEMSFVGPRPLLPEYLPRYNAQQKNRHSVKPGITGWAQINGRNSISWQKKFEMDIWYLNHVSFYIDFKILIATIFKVLSSKDINEDSSRTATAFLGNN